jgi:hypothetical protein
VNFAHHSHNRFEADPSIANRLAALLVGGCAAAERIKIVAREWPTIVCTNEPITILHDEKALRACVIRVLKQFDKGTG